MADAAGAGDGSSNLPEDTVIWCGARPELKVAGSSPVGDAKSRRVSQCKFCVFF